METPNGTPTGRAAQGLNHVVSETRSARRRHSCAASDGHERASGRYVEGWARKFDDPVDASSTARWKAVFKEHPEFFKIYVLKDQEKAALRWRYARRYFDHKQNMELTPEEAAKLPEQQRWLLTGKALSDGQLQGLIDTAIELYSKAVTAQQEKRWALTLLVPAVSGLAGTVVGALLQHFLTK